MRQTGKLEAGRPPLSFLQVRAIQSVRVLFWFTNSFQAVLNKEPNQQLPYKLYFWQYLTRSQVLAYFYSQAFTNLQP